VIGSTIRKVSAAQPAMRIRGRAAEVAALSEALSTAASGQLAIVLIEGEAGIGKTRLLAEALTGARGRGLQVAAGQAEELEQARPFGLVASVFGCVRSSPDPRRAGIAELLSAGTDARGPITVTSDPGLRFRAVDAFADLAEELALSGPLVVGVDDLQWADPSSLLTLAALSRRLAYLPVALVGCLRLAPRMAELDRLVVALEAAGARRLALTGLAEDAVRDLVADALTVEPGPELMAKISPAAGNPLFVTELLAALAHDGPAASSGLAAVPNSALPPTLRLTIVRRLSVLPEATLQILQAASVLGSSFTVTDLATVTGRSALDLSATLAPALTTQVIDDDGVHLRFRHDLLRDAIYADLPLSIRRALHREAGRRLADSHAPALQVAEHLSRGASAGDAEAILWLTRAAREAATTSPSVAADLMERAIAITDPTDPGRDGMLVEQASSLMWAGRVAAARRMCSTLLDRPHAAAADGPARLCLGYALVAQSQYREALPVLDRAAESPALTEAERAAARAWTTYARLRNADLDGVSAIAVEVRCAARADPLITSVAMAIHAEATAHRWDVAHALEIIDDAVRLADQSPGRQGHRFPIHTTRGVILAGLDRLKEATSTLEVGRRIGEELGIGWQLPNYQMISAFTRFLAGDWDDAIAEVEAAQDLADEIGENRSLILGHSVLALICVHRNDLSRARQAVSAAIGQSDEADPQDRALWAMRADAVVLEAEGEVAGAFALLAECWDRCEGLGLTVNYLAFGPDLVRLALAGDDRERAQNTAAAVAEIAQRLDVPSVTGAALHCRGLAESDAEILHAAAIAYARGPRPLELALASEDAGAALARQGDTGRARGLLEQAAAIYERLGAGRDLARIEAVFREADIRRGRRVARGRPQAGWRSLTPTEFSVAQLVAEGLTNPQIGARLFISRRTVQAHLAHIFPKLDVTSRAQLAALVAEHRGSQPI
jgi:DNA-binding CsgD family transcriptional regulator/tetratricopeptide (TPR) repeat protein